MSDLTVASGVALGVVGMVGLAVWRLRPRPVAVTFASQREEQLTLTLAKKMRCSPAAALDSVRTELRIAPDQTDAVILKRAEYHYRRNQPDTPYRVWSAGKPG
jgi:hypothetical protein